MNIQLNDIADSSRFPFLENPGQALGSRLRIAAYCSSWNTVVTGTSQCKMPIFPSLHSRPNLQRYFYSVEFRRSSFEVAGAVPPKCRSSIDRTLR
jgi:hypothetical protein